MTHTRKHRNSHKMGKTVKSYHGECCDATFHGIHGWFKSLFEELGWMILAKSRGMTYKTTVYKHSIERLKKAIEDKIASTKDYDKKNDLKIMHENILILWNHANKDL